jgi:hypothetical protein
MSTETHNMLKPLFLVKPGSVSRKDIERALRHSGVCIVECSETESARYSEPPMGTDLNEQARAALSLMRMVIASPNAEFKRGELTKWFVDAILNGRIPEKVPHVAAARRTETKP